MANTLVGDLDDSEYAELVTTLTSSTVSAIILRDWQILAASLEIQPVSIERFEKDLLQKKIQNSEVVREILFKWRSDQATRATLGTLVEIVGVKCIWKPLAELLQEIALRKARKWDDLYENQKLDILKSPVSFQNRVTTLYKIGEVLGQGTMDEIMRAHFHGDLMKTAVDGNMWLLFKEKEDQLCWNPTYYVQQTLLLQHKLDVRIFQAKSSDVFVFDFGLEQGELYNLVKPARIENSTSQMYKITARFIILDCKEDFEIIRKNWRNTDPSIHRIKHEDGYYLWESTTGAVHLIEQYLVDEPEQLIETQVIEDTLNKFDSRPVVVTGISGMGKTWLLSHMSKGMKLQYPDRHILFLSFPKLLETCDYQQEDSLFLSDVKHLLSSQMGTNRLGHQILFELMNKESVKFEVFLVAFDEIPSAQIPLAMKMLELLSHSNNIRAFLSTQPHMYSDLQQAIGVVCWKIKPFTEIEQAKFFINYWTVTLKTANHTRVKEFVDNCVKHFGSHAIINADIGCSKNLAWVPLYCYMLAQVCLEDARQFIESLDSEYKMTYQLSTLHDLYKQFTELKFQKLKENVRLEVKRAHLLAAVRHIFPHWVDKVHKILKYSRNDADGVNDVHILSVGILKSVNPPVFIHRTFAEYFIADFIASHLTIHQSKINCPEFSEFLFAAVLASNFTPFAAKITARRNDPIIQEFVVAVRSSSIWITIDQEYKRMMEALGMPDENAVPEFEDEWDLHVLLSDWAKVHGEAGNYQKLMQILRWELKWPAEVIEKLKNLPSTLKLVYLHGNVCSFLDALLSDQEYTGNTLIQIGQTIEKFGFGLDTESTTHFVENVVKCTAGGLGNLFRLLTKISSYSVNYTEVKSFQWPPLVIQAARQNVSLFEPLAHFIESLHEMKLFELNFDRSTWGQYYVTPLHEAGTVGNFKVVEYIVYKYGISINSELEGLLFHIVSFSSKDSLVIVNKKVEMIKFMVDNNIGIRLNEPVEVTDELEIQHVAPLVAHGIHVKLFKLLIELGASTDNAFDADLFIDNVLTYYTSDDIDELVDFLEKMGLADLLLRKNSRGDTGFRFCLMWDLLTPLTLQKVQSCNRTSLYDFGDTSTVFKAVVRSRWKSSLMQAFVEGFDCVNFCDEDGMTLLMHAAACKSYSSIKYLLSVGASANAKSKRGKSYLGRPNY